MNNYMKEQIEKIQIEMAERIKMNHIAMAIATEARYLTHQTPFLLPGLTGTEKLDFSRKTVTIMKHGSCGPTCSIFQGIDIQKDYFYPSIENIERDIKKRSLPNYVKKSLSEANL